MPYRLAMVRAVAARLATARSVADVAAATLSAAGEFLEAATSSLWLVTDHGSTLEMRYWYNADPRALELFARVPMSATDMPGPHVVATGEAQFVPSREARDHLWPAVAVAPTASEALVVLPLQVGDERIGVISFGFSEVHEFDEEDKTALLAAADQCAIALDRARLYEAERERADNQSLLAAISGIDPTGDWNAIARRAVELCIAEFADTCAVYVREGHFVRRVAFASATYPELGEQLVDHFPTPLTSESLHTTAIRTGQPRPVPGMRPRDLPVASPAPGYAAALRDVRLGPGWVFPLTEHGEAFGAMMFLARNDHALSPDAVELARQAAERTANLIVSASAFAEQRAALTALHEIVLPVDVEAINGFEVVARYVPLSAAGTIGGDWWDALTLPSGELAVAVGDVAGHGVAPAAVMGHARNALRMELVTGKTPAEALTNVTNFLDWTSPLAHCTAVTATLSPTTGTMRWSGAGHPPPLYITASGEVSFLPTPPTPPLGVKTRRMPSYPELEAVLAPGSTLLLYTDGLVEGRGRGIDVGMEQLAEAAKRIAEGEPLEEASDRILAELVDQPDDDICLVAARWTPAPAS